MATPTVLPHYQPRNTQFQLVMQPTRNASMTDFSYHGMKAMAKQVRQNINTHPYHPPYLRPINLVSGDPRPTFSMLRSMVPRL